MQTFVFSIFVIFISLGQFSLSQEITRKICSTTPSSDACQQIARNLEVACNYNQHSVDCLLNIQSNKTHLGKITGDEALLGASFQLENVVVLGEIRSRHPPSEFVVIVKSDVGPNLISLQQKKLCHPGYNHDSTFSYSLLQELENKIIKLQEPECNENVTLLERHIRKLSTFFSSSCRPGQWTQNTEFDKILKARYSSLCELCDNENCDTTYSQPFNDSLQCLLNKNADVAVTTLQDAQKFFNTSSNSDRYKYMCKDGTIKPSSSPCIWSKKLPEILVAEKSMADWMKGYIHTNLRSYTNPTETSGSKSNFEDALVEIFKLHRYLNITLLDNNSGFVSLKQYVNERTTVPDVDNSKQCDRTLKWCTYSDLEQKKCEWLSQAAVNWGIQPIVECVRSEGDNELSCLDDIKKEKSDIVVASSDYAYISLNKGLTSIAFPETDTRNLSTIFTVVRADDTSIKSFKDLQDKSACIPQFGGKEHLALVDTIRTAEITNDEVCNYGQVLNEFIGDSCVPGVRSSLIKESTDCVDKDKMCRKCGPVNVTKTSQYCNADEINKYYGSQGSVNCLLNKDADFAVITSKDVANDTKLRALCKNNTLASINGLNLDTNCALFVFANSEVVVRNDTTKKTDIKLALYEFEKWFGQNLKKPFHLFDKFENQPNLLFLDSTPGLNFENKLSYIQEYQKLLERVRECNINNNASNRLEFSLLFVITAFLLLV